MKTFQKSAILFRNHVFRDSNVQYRSFVCKLVLRRAVMTDLNRCNLITLILCDYGLFTHGNGIATDARNQCIIS